MPDCQIGALPHSPPVLSLTLFPPHFRDVETITLKQVLEFMDAGQPFSISFVTADKRKNTGGEWIDIEKAYKSGYVDPEARKQTNKLQPASDMINRAPNHYQNSTRNIMIAANSDVRKVHLRLIRKFNGKTVV